MHPVAIPDGPEIVEARIAEAERLSAARKLAGASTKARKVAVRGIRAASCPHPEPEPRRAKPKESDGAWLERLQRQIDANARLNCGRMTDPNPKFNPSPANKYDFPSIKARTRAGKGRREREFGGIPFDLGISERG